MSQSPINPNELNQCLQHARRQISEHRRAIEQKKTLLSNKNKPTAPKRSQEVQTNYGTTKHKMMFIKRQYNCTSDLIKLKGMSSITPKISLQPQSNVMRNNAPSTLPENYNTLPKTLLQKMIQYEQACKEYQIQRKANKQIKDRSVEMKQVMTIVTPMKASIDIPMKIPIIPHMTPDVTSNVTPDKTLSLTPDKTLNVTPIPVDPHFSLYHRVRVCVTNGVAYSATFNFSNITKNINRFYIVQVLQLINKPEDCFYYIRRGRTGELGRTDETGPMPFDVALKRYTDKVQERLHHGYRLVVVNYQEKVTHIKSPSLIPHQTVSKLDPSVQELMKLLFDMKMVSTQLKQIGYDCDKLPLGKLTASNILKGYGILKCLLDQVKCLQRSTPKIQELTSCFYSLIPHDFGRRNMAYFVIDTQKKIKDKLELLQSLQVLTDMLELNIFSDSLNQIDANYLKLGVNITPLSPSSPTHALIMRYANNTHASHHHFQCKVEAIYQIDSPRERAEFNSTIPNRWLLWHGSRLTNFIGILTQGLRIAPPEAPVTGYMFGKGIYFADMISKSANYCQNRKTGCVLLCEVALGRQTQKYYADYYANLLPAEMHSVKGVGKIGPSSGEWLGQVFVPNGIAQQDASIQSALKCNEYVVYNKSQTKCRFLLRVSFS